MAKEEKVAKAEEKEEVTPGAGTPEDKAETLEDLQAKNKELQDNYAAMQRNLSSRDMKLRELEAQLANNQTLMAQIYALREEQAAVADELAARREVGEGEPEQRRPSRVAKLRAETKPQQDWERYAQAKEAEIDEMLSDAELDKEDERLAEVKNLFVQGKVEDAVREVRKVTKQVRKEQQDKLVKDAEAKADEIVRKRLEEAGLLEVETGGPSGKSGDAFAELEKRFIEDPDKYSAEYAKARREKGI